MSKLVIYCVSYYSTIEVCQRFIHMLLSPPFGSNAAGSACDGTVYMRQVGVVPCVVPGANLKARAVFRFQKTCFSGFVPFHNLSQSSIQNKHMDLREKTLHLSQNGMFKLCVCFIEKAIQ